MLTILTLDMKALIFTSATQIVCDSAQSEVGFCLTLVILFQYFIHQPYVHGFYIKIFFSFDRTLFVHNEITCEKIS